jgi:plasmid stability protein
MKAITLRNIPPAVEKAIRARARQKKISLNQAVIELLQEPVGDLDRFIGSWTSEEAREFDEALAEIRRIDPEN